MQITIYSTPTCPYCVLAKKFLEENGKEFTEIDISVDQKAAREMVKKTGQMGVPVIMIDKDGKEEVVLGFDRLKLFEILGI